MYTFIYQSDAVANDISHKALKPGYMFADDLALINPDLDIDKCSVRLVASSEMFGYETHFVQINNIIPMPEIVLLAICGFINDTDLNEFTIRRVLANVSKNPGSAPFTPETPAQHLELILELQSALVAPVTVGGISTYICDEMPVTIVELLDYYSIAKEFDEKVTASIRSVTIRPVLG